MAALSDVPLISRKTLFGNASHLEPKLSPDGRWLAITQPGGTGVTFLDISPPGP